jgi:hypothetical protein
MLMTKPGKLFTCSLCRQEFESETSDEEKRAEFERIFGMAIDAEPVGEVCHPCWLAMGLDKVGEHEA